MKEIKFKFDNDEAAEQFLSWLCNQGEQGYWEYMQQVERHEDGDVTVVEFDYWANDEKKFGKGAIIAKCGRLNNV